MSVSPSYETDAHPRLLFCAEDVPRLRRNAERVLDGSLLRAILARCEACCDPSHACYIDAERWRGARGPAADNWGNPEVGAVADALHCLAFAHVLTGEDHWAAKAVAIMLAHAGTGGGAGSFSAKTALGQLPLAFDMLHECMTPEERACVGDYLRASVVEVFRKYPLGAIANLGTNCVLPDVQMTALALGAVYDPAEDRDAMRDLARFVRRSIHLALDEGGAIYEGPGYGFRDAEWIAVGAEVLRTAGVADLWTEESRLAAMCRHWAHLMLPGGGGLNAIGDASRPSGVLWAALVAARRLDDPVLQWLFDRTWGDGRDPGKVKTPGYGILWADPDVTPVSPDEAGWPRARNSGRSGLVTMRGGWAEDDLYFSLTASGREPASEIHQHVDGGHFSLFALGEAFSIDPGYGDTAGEQHSVMRPGAREPVRSPNGWGHMPYGGRVHAFAAGEGADYACVDVGEQWEIRCAYRHALHVHAPGAEPYVLILDCVDPGYIVKDSYQQMQFSPPLCYEWLMQSEPGNRIEIDEGAVRAVVHGRRNRLEAAFSCPEQNEYRIPHRIEMATDEFDSYPMAHQKRDSDHRGTGDPARERPLGGGRLGIGVRPRLKVNLWGCNGLMLSALMPRRAEDAPVKTKRLTTVGHFGLKLDFGDAVDTVIAAPIARRVDLGGLLGEATLSVARRNAAGELLWWASADAYHLVIDGEEVLPHQPEPVALATRVPRALG